MKSTIKLTGIKASGRHGANPGEQDFPQDFLIDLEIEVDVQADELDRTVDYQEIADKIRKHVKDNSYKLIETMAYSIASDVKQSEKATKVLVVVHKPSAAKILEVDDVNARAMI